MVLTLFIICIVLWPLAVELFLFHPVRCLVLVFVLSYLAVIISLGLEGVGHSAGRIVKWCSCDCSCSFARPYGIGGRLILDCDTS